MKNIRNKDLNLFELNISFKNNLGKRAFGVLSVYSSFLSHASMKTEIEQLVLLLNLAVNL